MTLKSVDQEEIPLIEVSYTHLNTHNVKGPLNKLAGCPTLDIKTAYWVGRIVKKLDSEMERIGKEYFALVSEFAEKDSSGLPLKDESGGAKIEPTKFAEFEAKHKEFMAKTVTLEWAKVSADLFSKVGLTPADVVALEPLLHGLN